MNTSVTLATAPGCNSSGPAGGGMQDGVGAATIMGTEMGGIPETMNGTVGGRTATGGAATAAAGDKRPVRRGGKPQPERPIRALFCLGLKNPLRKVCILITEWK